MPIHNKLFLSEIVIFRYNDITKATVLLHELKQSQSCSVAFLHAQPNEPSVCEKEMWASTTNSALLSSLTYLP